MASPYAPANEAEHLRLVTLARGLGEDGLRQPLEGGWTVATALLHVAFWDEYCATLLEHWVEHGFTPTRVPFDAVNAAVAAMAASVPPSAVPGLVASAAEHADAAVEAVPEDLLAIVEGAGYQRIMDRAAHRVHHLDRIEVALVR